MLRHQRIAYAIVRSLLRLAVLLLTRTSVRGREHLPRAGAGIVVSNHIAAVDPGVLVAVLPRPIALMSKVENARGVLKLFMPLVGAFTVRRGAADRRALRMAVRVLEQGRLLCIFPEGTRSVSGVLGSAHGGTAQRDDRERATGEIMAHIAALLPPEQRGRHVSQGQMEQ